MVASCSDDVDEDGVVVVVVVVVPEYLWEAEVVEVEEWE